MKMLCQDQNIQNNYSKDIKATNKNSIRAFLVSLRKTSKIYTIEMMVSVLLIPSKTIKALATTCSAECKVD